MCTACGFARGSSVPPPEISISRQYRNLAVPSIEQTSAFRRAKARQVAVDYLDLISVEHARRQLGAAMGRHLPVGKRVADGEAFGRQRPVIELPCGVRIACLADDAH